VHQRQAEVGLHCCVEFSTYTCAWYYLLCYACIAYIYEWVKKNWHSRELFSAVNVSKKYIHEYIDKQIATILQYLLVLSTKERERIDLNWKVDWAATLMLCSITYSMWGNFPRRLNYMLAYQKKDYYTEQYV
jgi:hypothetical protein